MKIGRRFIFGVVAIICLTIASVKLTYGGDIYIKGLAIITGLFMAGQTITDSMKKKEAK